MTKLQKQEQRANKLSQYILAEASDDEKQTLSLNAFMYSIGRRDILEAIATLAYFGAKQNKELNDILEQLKD